MIRRQFAIAALVIDLLLVIAAAASAQTPLAYRVEDIGTLGGTHTVGLAINSHGEIAGYARLADGSYHAVRWTEAGGLEDLGANGGWTSQAIAINDNGDVVGVYLDADKAHGFLAPRGGPMRDLYSEARKISRVNSITNDGRMTGMLELPDSPAQVHAFRTLPDGSIEDLGGAFASEGWHVNASGDVTGFEMHEDGSSQSAFRFSDLTGKVDLGTLGGERSAGLSINSSGVVVGWSEAPDGVWSRAFRARPGFAMEDLGALEGLDVAGAEAINEAGDIVGWSSSSHGFTPFLYTNARGMVDLRSRIKGAAIGDRELNDAYAINDAGQIVVGYRTPEGSGTYRFTPVVDAQPPAVSAAASPAVLWPPNGSMMPVAVNVTATDDYDDAPACAIVNVTNTEHLHGGADPDVQITGPLTLSLRAPRRSGHGRVYLIKVRCADFSGNAANAYSIVVAPTDR